ncbi:MAG: ABC transporter substrate-binding protein [Paracoccaceae bacterium]|nr:ABC transporter substrate-binding protein [Paracoccaceae bacterium]
MNKNIILFLGLLIGSIQIAWCKPDRIISLSPTATEMLFAIGAGEKVVAVDSHSNFPNDAPLTNLSALEPNLEAIALYKPDLVIISFDIGNLKVGLNAVGIEVLKLPAVPTVEDALKQILEIGNKTGNEESAERLVLKMRRRINEIAVEREGKPELLVYHELDENYYSPSRWSFLGNIYDILGFKNIADEADPNKIGYPKLSVEYILSSNPDIIVTGGLGNDSLLQFASRPGWNTINAVQNKTIIMVEPDISGRWGPRIVEFCEQIVQKLRIVGYD